MTHHNIVVFGDAGSGKSSLINMLLGFDAATTSGSAFQCTIRSASYNITINNTLYTLHDTTGLNESEHGRVPHADAVVQLYSLMKKLQDGISLLLFVIRAPARMHESTQSTWKLFTEIMCRNEVPTAVVVTNLEQEEDMDAWWPAHQDRFAANGIYPSIHACVTTVKGKKLRSGAYIFQEEYDESREKVQRIISVAHRYHPWKMESIEWLNRAIYETYLGSVLLGNPIVDRQRAVNTIRGAVEDLVAKCGMYRVDAEYLAEKLSRV